MQGDCWHDSRRVPDELIEPEAIGRTAAEPVEAKREGSAWRLVDGVVKGRPGNAAWYTSLTHGRRHAEPCRSERYDPAGYPKYDHYDATEVSSIAGIPVDVDGAMGLPVTFPDRYNPEQFALPGSNRGTEQDPKGIHGRGSYLNGKETYQRLFIRNRRPRQ